MQENCDLQYRALSVIVPISRMAGKLDLMFSWVETAISLQIQLVLVHDYQDKATSRELKERLAKFQHQNLRFVEAEYKSPGFARNAGLELAEGTWIQFVDSDDLPDLQGSLSLIEEARSDSEILIGQYEYWSSITKKTSRLVSTGDSKLDLALNPGIWRLIMKRDCLVSARFSEYRMGEDQLFLLQSKLFSRKLEFFERIIYRYTIGQDNQLTSQGETKKEIIKLIPSSLSAFSQSSGTDEKYIGVIVARQLLTALKSATRSKKDLFEVFELIKKLIATSHQKRKLFFSVLLVLKNRNKYRES